MGLEYPDSTLKEAFNLCLDGATKRPRLLDLFKVFAPSQGLANSYTTRVSLQRPCHPPPHVESNSRPSSVSYVEV